MKFTQLLYKQHIGRAIRTIWQVQRHRPILDTSAEKILAPMGIVVKDALEVVTPKKEFFKFEFPSEDEINEIDSGRKEQDCLSYKQNNLLQAGVSQACLLTKTVKIADELPKRIEDLIGDVPEHIDNLVQRIVSTSLIYDAEQVKLPKIKDPNRPAWVFPRMYGISIDRKVRNLFQKLLQLCESLSGSNTAQTRYVINNGITSVCIEKEMDLLQFEAKSDLMVLSLTHLSPIANQDRSHEFNMPDLYPLHHTIGLTHTKINKTEDVYPIDSVSPWVNVHTIFISNDPERVKSLTELPVTEDQIYARSLMKQFTTAAACARKKFGSDVKQLPEPVTVQCIQSNGQSFHFSVFQLNTLDINGTEGIKNFWWSMPSMSLYEKAQYEKGRPTLEGYNIEVFKKLFAFYKNR